MRGKIGWATVAVGLALCASPSLTMATALVKISVRIPEGAAAGDKLGPTEELARLLLGPRVQASLLPSAAERGTTLRYQAAQWNQAVDEARRDAACAELLKLWGAALTIESPDGQVRPDPAQAASGDLQPQRAETWKPAFKAMGLVDTPAFRSASFTQAYDNGRAAAAQPPVLAAAAAPISAAAAGLAPRAVTPAPAAQPLITPAAPKALAPALSAYAPEAGVPDLSPDPAQQPIGLYEGVIVPIAEEYGVSPDMIRAIITAKSGADATLHPEGAPSLMGVSGSVALAYGYQAKDLSDPAVNVRVGTRLLSELLRQFDGDIHRALAAFQLGSAAVIKSRGIPNDPGVKDFLKSFEKAYRGRLPKRSVQAVQAPTQSLAGEVATEAQEGAAGLVDLSRGDPKVSRYRPLIQKMADLAGVDAGIMEAMAH